MFIMGKNATFFLSAITCKKSVVGIVMLIGILLIADNNV